jgi:hypothetical protein
MPNWCDCELSINAIMKGHPSEKRKTIESLKRFVALSRNTKLEEDLYTNAFIPYPKRFRARDRKSALHHAKVKKAIENITDKNEREKIIKKLGGWSIKDGFNNGGYDWCLQHWGTKWGFCHSKLIESNFETGRLLYRFDTAWSPPTPLIHKMSLMYPNFIFTLNYFEGGMGFKGKLKVQNGTIIKNYTSHYRGGRGG